MGGGNFNSRRVFRLGWISPHRGPKHCATRLLQSSPCWRISPVTATPSRIAVSSVVEHTLPRLGSRFESLRPLQTSQESVLKAGRRERPFAFALSSSIQKNVTVQRKLGATWARRAVGVAWTPIARMTASFSHGFCKAAEPRDNVKHPKANVATLACLLEPMAPTHGPSALRASLQALERALPVSSSQQYSGGRSSGSGTRR